MPTWNAGQYLQFADERTQPCRDLAARIALNEPARIVDLGCGPGNSTAVLAERWPKAEITGLDSSAEMIAAAQKSRPDLHWMTGDIASWQPAHPCDLIFSNAALQWVPDHATIYPHLVRQLAPGGALAVQVPGNLDAPAHHLMRELAASTGWRNDFSAPVREWFVHDLPFYYDLLSPVARRMDLWVTEYQHILAGPEAIVEWYKGTGLRPFLDTLKNSERREQFFADYLELITPAYPRQSDGCVIFPFKRLFMVAYL